MTRRSAKISRTTRETTITVSLELDQPATPQIKTGLGFLDHMLYALAFHWRVGLELASEGDLWIDDHHTVEDTALALGEALDRALGDRRGIARFGSAYTPLDEALARAVIDLSGRPHACVNLDLRREQIGTVACENLTHFFLSFATAARLTLHLDTLRGENDHHKAEAAFKAIALALGQATSRQRTDEIRSTKGRLVEERA